MRLALELLAQLWQGVLYAIRWGALHVRIVVGAYMGTQVLGSSHTPDNMKMQKGRKSEKNCATCLREQNTAGDARDGLMCDAVIECM